MDTIDRLFNFGAELSQTSNYVDFCKRTDNLSKIEFPIVDSMSPQEKKVMIASRAKMLMQENIVTYEYGMELIQLVSRSTDEELEEYCCF